jgi:uncharacterized repeat protein (TIGR03803 family)
MISMTDTLSKGFILCGIATAVLTPLGNAAAKDYQVLYSFCNDDPAYCLDGNSPQAGLIADKAGNLYGTTVLGGATNNGTVVKLSPPADGQTLWGRRCSIAFALKRTVPMVPNLWPA